jgi:hypothetical protein
MEIIAVFGFVVWFWLIIVIYGDLFRRHDISGWAKALCAGPILLPSHLCLLGHRRERYGRT